MASPDKPAWLEPGRYRFAVLCEDGGLRRLGRSTVISAMVLFGGLGAWEFFREMKMGWPATMGVAAGIWAGFLFLSWVTPCFPANVYIHETGINRNAWQGTAMVLQFWSWDKIEACHLGMRKIRGRDYPAMWLIAPGGTVMDLIGIDRKTSEESIRLAVGRYGRETRGSLAVPAV